MTSWDWESSFCTCSAVVGVSDIATLLSCRSRVSVPQPNTGVPGAGALTLTFLGEAGVAGRADMADEVL